MQAVILAGGLGTRLQSVVSDVPKPMAPINGVPFLEYILKSLKKKKVTRAILSVGHKWEVIKDYFGDEFDGIHLEYSVEKEPLGTGGAIKKAIKNITVSSFFIINGDTFFDVNLEMMKKNIKNTSRIMLALKPMFKFDRYGCVESNEEGFVSAFTEKGFRETGNINGGIYLARKNLFEGFNLPEKFSFEEFMEKNFNKLNTSSMAFDRYFIDIGIPDDFERAQTELESHI